MLQNEGEFHRQFLMCKQDVATLGLHIWILFV